MYTVATGQVSAKKISLCPLPSAGSRSVKINSAPSRYNIIDRLYPDIIIFAHIC